MTGFLRLVIFFLIFLIVIRLLGAIKRIWFSSNETTGFIRHNKTPKPPQYTDVEEAEFREIPSDKKSESKENID